MARIAKSLVPPEQGYPHRDHRSAKGRNPLNHPIQKKKRNRRKRMLEQRELGYKRKGKWI
jgi:hypothetical protein